MILVKIQINHEDKNFTFQLEFDPNFTVENLISSIIDLFRLQNNIIYLTTSDNDILIPNLKIVELIFLNPNKYRNLKVLLPNSFYQIPQADEKNEKNFASKRYDVVLQSTSDYADEKNKFGYGQYKLNDEVNIISNNMSDYNPSNENTLEPSSEIHSNDFKYRSDTLSGIPKDKDRELIQHKMNYLKSKNNTTYEDDYLKERHAQGYDEYAYNNKSNHDLNKDNMSMNTLTNTNTNTNLNNTPILKNTNNYDYNNYYDKDSVYKKGITNLNTTIKKYDYAGSSEELDNKLNNKYGNKYMTYGDNNSNSELKRDNNNINNNNKELNINDRSRSKMERDHSNSNINTYSEKFQKTSSKKDMTATNINDDSNRIENMDTNQNSEFATNKYNYSDRLKDDMNRQRYSSEKRNFRNNQYRKFAKLI